MSNPQGQSPGLPPSQRNRTHGREQTKKNQHWKFKKRDDPTQTIIEDRARLSVVSGLHLPSIQPPSNHESLKIYPLPWPEAPPLLLDQGEFDREFEAARRSISQASNPHNSESTNIWASVESKSIEHVDRSTLNKLSEPGQALRMGAREESVLMTVTSVAGFPPESSGFVAQNHDSDGITVDDSSSIASDDDVPNSEQHRLEEGLRQHRHNFRSMLESVKQKRELTFSIFPTTGQKFSPDEPWDGRHHVNGRHNEGIHELNREFFYRPQRFDPLTKPRRPLPPGPIVKRIMARMRPSSEDSIGVAHKHSKPPQPEAFLVPSPIRAKPSNVHSESYNRPFAQARSSDGNHHFVPRSLSL